MAYRPRFKYGMRSDLSVPWSRDSKLESLIPAKHAGVVLAGKSTLAQQLASRLNLPNVLQTDIIYEVRASSTRCGFPRPWPVAVNDVPNTSRCVGCNTRAMRESLWEAQPGAHRASRQAPTAHAAQQHAAGSLPESV